MSPPPEIDALLDSIATTLGSPLSSATRVHGGDVAISYRLDLADGRRVFAKSHADPPPHHFTTEASGLRWLGEGSHVRVPEVLAVSDAPPFLILEWIEEGASTASTEADLGRALADLHRSGAPAFGREDRRTTGSRGLPNEPCDTWEEFYSTQRLLPLVRIAHDGNALDRRVLDRVERIAHRLSEFIDSPAAPARLHGDLWAGNRLVDRQGQNWLIDPAAHGGHREFDLAMMRLFGGFGEACFNAYDEVHPLDIGWQERVPLHQLAPLIVHAVKFGGGYRAAVESALAGLL